MMEAVKSIQEYAQVPKLEWTTRTELTSTACLRQVKQKELWPGQVWLGLIR